MKSILVDALRQANGDDTDQALSDSGSFDASQENLEAPANDSLEHEEGELELMSTTSALVVREEETVVHDHVPDESGEDVQVLELDEGPVDDKHAITVVGLMPLPVLHTQTPGLARFAPLLCVLLAVAVASSWLLINTLGISGGSLGTKISQSDGEVPQEAPGADASIETRFPFLEDEQAPEGTAQ